MILNDSAKLFFECQISGTVSVLCNGLIGYTILCINQVDTVFDNAKEVQIMKLIDMTNERYGRLVVLKKADKRTANGNAQWVCKCDCGNYVVADRYSLVNGTTKSCGCLRREQSRQAMLNDPRLINGRRTGSLVNKDGIPYATLIRSKRNKSGHVGVSYDKTRNKYVARLMVHGEYVLNSVTDSMQDAIRLRKEAEQAFLKQA